MTTIYTERPSRRKPVHRLDCDDGLSIPTISEAAVDLEKLTGGGREIYRRTRRPVPTCNLIASIAGIGQMEAH
jgi:hypothetical protein